MNTINLEFLKYGGVYDRSVGDLYSLPFSYEEVEIQPNELATANSFNIVLEKLYKNFLYLYKQCVVANFQVPEVYSGWYGVSGLYDPGADLYFQLFSPTTPVTNAGSFSNIGYVFEYLKDSKNALSFFTERRGYPVVVAANKNNIVCINFQNTNFNAKLSLNSPFSTLSFTTIDPLSGSLNFLDIRGIAYDDSLNKIYVSDGQLNNLYKYNIDDTLFQRNFKYLLEDFVGGKGTAYDGSKFDEINKISFDAGILYVEDTNNKCIKCFDKDLNFIQTSVLVGMFNDIGKLAGLIYDSNSNTIFAAAKKKIYTFKTVNNILHLHNIYNLSSTIIGDDTIVDIKLAGHSKKILYILTKKLLIEKWITKLNETIGVYPVTNLSNDNEFKWLVTFANPSLSSSNVLLYNTAGNLSANNIAVYQDSFGYNSLLKNVNFTIYDLQDILINKNEYNQAWIYNKAFKKLFYNHAMLKHNIGYRFFEGRTVEQLLTYVEKQYNTSFIDDPNIDTNSFVNVCINENFQSSVINRNIKKIYDYQYDLLTAVVNAENIRKNLLPTFRTVDSNIFDFILYSQGDGVSITPNTFKMYSNTDGFISVNNSLNISNLAPYLSGDGITII